MRPGVKTAITAGLLAGSVLLVMMLVDHACETRVWRVFRGGRR